MGLANGGRNLPPQFAPGFAVFLGGERLTRCRADERIDVIDRLFGDWFRLGKADEGTKKKGYELTHDLTGK